MKQTQNTRVVSCGKRGGGVLSCAREKATAVACTWAAPDRENTETVASKQKQPPSAGLDIIYTAYSA